MAIDGERKEIWGKEYNITRRYIEVGREREAIN